MYNFIWSRERYLPLFRYETDEPDKFGGSNESDTESSTTDNGENCTVPEKYNCRKRRAKSCSLAGIIIAILVVSVYFGKELGAGLARSAAELSVCGIVQVRREWRSLSDTEKHNFIDAVRCLTNRPSKQLPQYSLYDDFSYVHHDTGPACESAYSGRPSCCE